jgi:hypothetical protein
MSVRRTSQAQYMIAKDSGLTFRMLNRSRISTGSCKAEQNGYTFSEDCGCELVYICWLAAYEKDSMRLGRSSQRVRSSSGNTLVLERQLL